jgi:tetratricopeptide (TPR) repeat protein
MNRTLLRVLLLTASTGLALLAAYAYWSRESAPDVKEFGGPRDGASAGTFRIYVVGGSAAAGCPYETRFDFGRLVAWLYGGALGGREIVVRSYAGSGEDSLYALEDTRALVAAEDDPSNAALLVYSGNNEFVRVEPAQDLSRRERQLFDRPFVGPEEAAAILRTCEERLTEVVRTARAAGMRVLVSTIAVNLGDWEPDRSVLADPENEERVRAAIEAGEVHAAAGRREEALAAFRAGQELEPHFAWLSWRAGELLRDLGRFAEARVELQRALDDNGGPNAATSAENAMLRAIAAREAVTLVDAEAVLQRSAANGIPGFDLFWDNCHPNTEGYLRIAEAFAEGLAAATGERPTRTNPTPVTIEELERSFGIDDGMLARIWIGRAQYAYAASCLVWNPTRRLALSRGLLDRAAVVLPDDVDLLASRAILALFEDRPEESRADWRRAWSLDAEAARKRMKNRHVRGLLRRFGVEDGPRWVQEAR